MTHDEIHTRLTQNTAHQEQLLTDFRNALAVGDMVKQTAIQQQLAKLLSEMQRLNSEQRYAKSSSSPATPRPRARATGKTIREQVLDILDEIGVPVSPATIGEFSL